MKKILLFTLFTLALTATTADASFRDRGGLFHRRGPVVRQSGVTVQKTIIQGPVQSCPTGKCPIPPALPMLMPKK